MNESLVNPHFNNFAKNPELMNQEQAVVMIDTEHNLRLVSSGSFED